ncbi:hypothetical protein [Protaetiibacter mangrovi]|uniref:DUF4337 domain-containing protein n=1 Tax=Protaetiibacter mangrovi TaxID=2970926 RepID=A0ABT1ZCB8_9MICO|nr:hypothetical protein [Protaetiibacter mangrovi]MCS0498336.1 hypothetical protein [Protaetiibacter mangrovi]TPX02696.1 hypothetical protein FJ656_21050 [Schumannella luteola]
MSKESAPRRARNLLDIAGVFMLSIVAVLTAWCGFESSKWGGEMSIAFSQASSARVQAVNAEGEARDNRAFDLAVYASWVEAKGAGDEALAAYVEERFPAEFATAFDAWRADGMVEPSPFARAEYVPDGTERAADLTATADAAFQRALDNNRRGDNYSLLTVLFALVLFLTAMSQRKLTRWVALTLLGLAAAVAVVGVVIMATFPILV